MLDNFTIVPGRWYTWQMIPGYLGDYNVPYFSPIFMRGVTPLKSGKGILHLDFVNVCYAEGVQGFEVDLRILKHTSTYLVAEIDYPGKVSDRTAVVSAIEYRWLQALFPSLVERYPIDWAVDVQDYLFRVTGVARPQDTERTSRG